ncbi:MAG: hypothetical protein R6V45_03170 [Oceanipulchritudo sp.]
MTDSQYFIGWDVGGWNCDRNSKSRDAIAILDNGLSLVGEPWRGNLRETINSSTGTAEWLRALFRLCGTEVAGYPVQATMAIDTPLGFPKALRALANNLHATGAVGESAANPYLYRKTEQFMFERGWKPLSPVKDMIGSQATKGMHVLAKFAPRIASCGIWTNGSGFQAIEGYPTPCRQSRVIRPLRELLRPMPHPDCEDALLCALLAHLFKANRDALESPDVSVPECEGWIWFPKR